VWHVGREVVVEVEGRVIRAGVQHIDA
jgi:hypothetical protein